MQKVLVIRFSSIGDVVLTTPVVRCLHVAGFEVHFLIKKAFAPVLDSNPHIHTLHTLNSNTVEELKREKFDCIVDLQGNLRSTRIRFLLRVKSHVFPKLNFKKWILVRTKRNLLPDLHIVDRYFKATKALGVENDKQGLDFYIPKDATHPMKGDYIALVLGAAHFTKQIPLNKAEELILALTRKGNQVALVGGPKEKELGEQLSSNPGVWNGCGELSIPASAALMRDAQLVITPDTGMMHIAAALGKRIFSIWGNTVPELGMTPYQPNNKVKSEIFEVKLPCRPCSKIGFGECPKKHFKCMMDQDMEAVVEEI